MSRELALGFLRSGNNGAEILQILESISADWETDDNTENTTEEN